MQRLAVVLAAVLVAVVPVGAVAAGAPATAAGVHDAAEPTSDQHANETANATDDAVAPGQRLATVVEVQAVEIDGAVEERTFGIRVARAATNDSRARVLADQLSEIRTRLDELERRQESLEERRADGDISEGRYRAEVTELSARAATLERLANASERTADTLPADVLERNGVNATAIRMLREDAASFTGPEVAAIARSIAGGDVGRPVWPERPVPVDERDWWANVTPGNATDALSAEQVEMEVEATELEAENARTLLNQTREAAGSDAGDALDRAEANLSAAEDALEAARTALEEGDVAAAEEHLAAAQTHLEAAQEAIASASETEGGY